ncbi:MAG: hypothetical protein BGP06_01790 [Rhizobiales bacterium 65-9]|nr:hypothetical protein [Hyphomicrobiales bacterium]OJY37681.1 MAG: hypothetical protein BGP06_01790 [Rhizobiales bacterium 65-9]
MMVSVILASLFILPGSSVITGAATSPNIFWVNLKKLDFSESGPVRKLDIGVDMGRILTGEVSSHFAPAKPFDFLIAE